MGQEYFVAFSVPSNLHTRFIHIYIHTYQSSPPTRNSQARCSNGPCRWLLALPSRSGNPHGHQPPTRHPQLPLARLAGQSLLTSGRDRRGHLGYHLAGNGALLLLRHHLRECPFGLKPSQLLPGNHVPNNEVVQSQP
jgi:hypothetical protein